MCLFYLAYGLCIRSNFPLPGLSPIEATEEGAVDVEVRKTGLSLGPTDGLCQHSFDPKAQSALLFWPNAGNFYVHQGREILIEPAKGVADDLLRPFLLGPVLSVLLLQRGCCVLHASAVALQTLDSRESAIAFLGHSGQGKSTMATALHRRGHRALADDTIALPAPQTEAPLLLYPALPHLKLRAPSVEAFGEKTANLPRWHPDYDSFVLRLSPALIHEPAPLRCFYVLEDTPSLSLEHLALPEALMFLMRHAYSVGLLPESELGGSFQACVQLAHHVPVFKLRRPKDFRRLPDVVQTVEEHQKSLSDKTKFT